MGLYDRDYGREPSSGNPFTRMNSPFTGTMCLMALGCFVISLFQRDLALRMGLSWEGLIRGRELWTPVTHILFHPTFGPNALIAFVFYMLIIFFFGKELEDRLGPRGMAWITGGAAGFAALVFLAGTGSGLFQADSLLFGVPVLANAILIAGVLIDPRRTFLLFFVLPVPGWLLVVVSLLFELASVARWDLGTGQAAGNIAGLLAGGLAYQMLTGAWEWKWPRRNTSFHRRGRPRLAVFRGESPDEFAETAARPASRRRELGSAPVEPETSQTGNLTVEVDRILEKISLQGLPSLTEAERRILLKASETLKKKP